MALAIDTTHSLRTLSELHGLAQSVHDAPVGEPETDALEWKITLDLAANAEDRFNVARHVLGMGNRSPAVAGRSFEGCGYLLVGVEPGSATGCPVWDPADIDNWMTRYVAPGSPRWHAAYVELNGVQVLVVTVEPPRPGDGIFTLQRDYGPSRAGRIFVRRGGTTQEASPAEVRALEARLGGARPTVDLDVAAVGEPHIAALVCDSEAARRWVEGEAERYDAALQSHRAHRRRSLIGPLIGDLRSEEEYIQEVTSYLEACGARFHAITHQQAIRQREGELVVAVHNPTPGNFERVQVTLTVPAGVQAFFDEDEPPDALEAPQVPDELGEGGILTPVRPVDLSSLAGKVERDAVVRSGEGLSVRYASVHLRPGGTETLPPLYLSVNNDSAGEHRQLSWRATSTSAESWVDGEITVPVASEAVDVSPAPGASLEE